MDLATFAGLANRATPEHWELVGVRQHVKGLWEAEFATGRGLAHVAFDFPPDDEAAAHGRDFGAELREMIASALAGHGQPGQAEERVYAETAPPATAYTSVAAAQAAQAGEKVSALSAEGRGLIAQASGSAGSAHRAALAAASWQGPGYYGSARMDQEAAAGVAADQAGQGETGDGDEPPADKETDDK
jgi:hypothetical protein